MNSLFVWTGTRAITMVLVLALISVVGIVGMLLVDPTWDWVLLLAAALPLAVGVKLVRLVKRSDANS